MKMRITILNGNPDAANTLFDNYLARLAEILTASQHSVTRLTLRDMDIRYCVGCFGCWVKRPGQCLTDDDSQQVCRAVINADFMLWASPLRMGFPSALLKKTMDKSIPLIHPYFCVDHNEAHHRARYDHYPRLGLLLEPEPESDEQDIRLVGDIFSRTALNMKSRLEFVRLTTQPVEGLARAITTGTASPVKFESGLAATTGVRIAPPTRLTVFNGSPRGPKGNTSIMLDQFVKGFAASGGRAGGRSSQVFHLNRLSEAERFQQAFAEAECVWLGFPLYTDAMPGIVKAFIETLEPFKGRRHNPPMGFLVQSGFPEAAHSRHVERYLEKLAARLGSPYLGTIVKGGGEGTRLMPDNMNRELFETLFQLGSTFGETGQLDPILLRRFARLERYPAYLAPVFQVFVRLPIASSYWDSQLKENGVYAQRFARPFVQ
jgi:multimeric flavodoxin WrbA